MSTSKLYVDHEQVARAEDGKFAMYVSRVDMCICAIPDIRSFSAFARIENHYFINEV